MDRGNRVRRGQDCAAFLLVLALASPAAAKDRDSSELADLTLEELTQLLVTSVSRREEPLSHAAGSVYVITAEQIRRAGATSLPEALRLAPNLHVARADANQYAIAARGFNGVLANKMLVLLDGRTLYSPLFSGVFWEAQHIVLENVERIEVISGPGGTLWGTNAVNGVINVITRPARETQGVLLSAGAGTTVATGIGRVGFRLSDAGHMRVHGRYTDVANTERAGGTSLGDESRRAIGGFRADWGESTHTFTLHGGAMHTDISQAPLDDRVVANVFLLGDWRARFVNRHGLTVQAYFDRSTRDQPGAIEDQLDTWDVELHHEFPPLGPHEILWGAGYRYESDRVDNLGPALAFIPDDQNLEHAQVFAQDRVRLSPQTNFIAGIRLERNIYTEWEYLPNVRLTWEPSDQRLIWGAWSRAVRAPARIDRELFLPASPPFLLLAGGPNFISERSNVGELGYRAFPTALLSYSITGFLHEFDRLRSLEPTPAGPVFANGLEATITGAEAWLMIRPREWWEVSAGWAELRVRSRVDAGVTALPGNPLGNDPNHWGTLRSEMDLGGLHEVDLWVRYVGALPSPDVPAYGSFNARYGLRLPRGFEFSITGFDLLGPPHAEWGADPLRPVYEPSVYAQVHWEGLR